MRILINALLLPFLFAFADAYALTISDTYRVDRQLHDQETVGTVFDFTQAGYSPSTDSITHVKLIYDFEEIDANYEEPPGSVVEGEFVIFSSWIFGWRDVYPDINTGLVVFETDWMRTDFCQFMNYNEEDGSESCWLNLDLDGRMNAFVTAYTDNLWLNSITAEIELARSASVPEPTSLLLLMSGIFLLAIRKLVSMK